MDSPYQFILYFFLHFISIYIYNCTTLSSDEFTSEKRNSLHFYKSKFLTILSVVILTEQTIRSFSTTCFNHLTSPTSYERDKFKIEHKK